MIRIASNGSAFLDGIDRDAPDWTGALCREVDPDLFFQAEDSSSGHAYDAGKEICAACALQAACLAYALEHDERYGLWGGKSPRERERMKAKVARAPTFTHGTGWGYRGHGCRCEPCTAAYAASSRRYNATARKKGYKRRTA